MKSSDSQMEADRLLFNSDQCQLSACTLLQGTVPRLALYPVRRDQGGTGTAAALLGPHEVN